jgi:hypothetical protein
MLAAILKIKIDDNTVPVKRISWKKKGIEIHGFHFWPATIFNIEAMLAAILKIKVDEDASRIERIL